MNVELKEKTCTACEAGTDPMQEADINNKTRLLTPDWKVVDNKLLKKVFPFENFKRGMAFAQEIAIIAEQQQHHPDICISYTNVEVTLTTHAINGLSDNDFIMAAKIDEL